MSTLRRSRIGLAAAALALTLPAAAHAATTVGSVAGTAEENSQLCPDETLCTVLGDTVIGANGVITGWHLKSGSVGNEVRLRVLRPAGGGKFTGAGTGAPQRITREDPFVNDYPERVPVDAGDILGLEAASQPLVFSNAAGTVRAFNPSPPDGATVAPTGTEPGARHLLISADVEPDGDDDGWGDETQDACPAAPDRHVAPCAGPVADIGVEQVPGAYGSGRRSLGVTLKVHNFGPATATSVELSDIDLAGGQMTSRDPRCVDAINPLNKGVYVKCPLGSIAPGQTVEVPVTLAGVGDGKDNPYSAQITNRIVAYAAEGDPRGANNGLSRTFNIAPVLDKKIRLDDGSFLVAGNDNFLRKVHILYTLNERATVEMAVKGPNGYSKQVRFGGTAGFNSERFLFSKGGLLSRLKPGLYTSFVTATDPGLLQSVKRKFNFRVLDKRPG
jgi:Domain of unknown function DUF11